MLGIALLIAYLGSIVAANAALARFGIVPVGFHLAAPAGVDFAGLGFTLRDLVQDRLGRSATHAAIVLGAGLSALISPRFALASGAAFLFSEGLDFAVYTPLRSHHWLAAVTASNVAVLIVDSALFLALAFGSLHFIAGQIVGKVWVTAVAVALLGGYRALFRHHQHTRYS